MEKALVLLVDVVTQNQLQTRTASKWPSCCTDNGESESEDEDGSRSRRCRAAPHVDQTDAALYDQFQGWRCGAQAVALLVLVCVVWPKYWACKRVLYHRKGALIG